MVGGIAVGIGTDMSIQQKSFAVFDEPVGVFEIRLAFTDGLYFGTPERHTCLESIQQGVIVGCDPVYRRIPLTGRNGVPGLGFLRGCSGGLNALTGHTV